MQTFPTEKLILPTKPKHPQLVPVVIIAVEYVNEEQWLPIEIETMWPSHTHVQRGLVYIEPSDLEEKYMDVIIWVDNNNVEWHEHE